MKTAHVSVPASTANLGAGFDCLALALGLRNTVAFEQMPAGLEIQIEGEGAEHLPRDSHNLIVKAAETVFARVGRRPAGLRLRALNGIPLGSGMGSSAAAVVGGLAAADALVEANLGREQMLRLAHAIEGHPDNAAAALWGGLTLVSADPSGMHARRLSLPPLTVVIALPDIRLATADARAALPQQVPMQDAVFNLGHALFTVQALTAGDFELLRWAAADRLHQPYRRQWIRGYAAVERAALEAGASAVTLSGAGPALAAFAPAGHEQIAGAMRGAFEAAGVNCRTFVLPADEQGIEVTPG